MLKCRLSDCRIAVTFSVLIGFLASGSAVAQIEEIIVTAQKRTESLQEIPLTVSAITANDIQNLRIRSSTEIASQIPNFQIMMPYGESQPVFVVRGISMSDFGLNQTSPIVMYVDEGVKGPFAMQGMQMYDLERIEVLKGPQGTLYGRNATGGTVNVITKKPSFDGLEGYLTAGVGSDNRYEVNGAVNTTLMDERLAARVAFTYAQQDGYVEVIDPSLEDQASTDVYAVRLSFLARPFENVEAILRLHKAESDPINYGGLSVVANPAFGGVGFAPGNDRSGLGFFENNVNFTPKLTHDNEGIAFTLKWDFMDDLTLTSITTYDEANFASRADDDGSPLSITHTLFSADSKQVAQELRITSSYAGPFNWIAGFFYSYDEVNTNSFIENAFEFAPFNPADPLFGQCDIVFFVGCIAENSFNQERDSVAGFLHTTYDFTENVTIAVGVRYTKDEITLNDYFADVNDPSGNFPFTLIPTVAQQKEDSNKATGTVSIDYKIRENILTYFSVSRGYRIGAFNGLAFFSTTEVNAAKPEVVDAVEVGFKSKLFNERVRLNGAFFNYEYNNLQFLNTDPLTFALTIENAKATSMKGFDLEMLAKVTDEFTINAGLGFLDAKYDDLLLSGLDLSGNHVINAPEWMFNIGANYVLPTPSMGTFTIHFDANYTDDQFFDAFNDNRVTQDAYWLANARLTWDSPGDSFSVGVWAKNLWEKEYVVFAQNVEAFSNSIFNQRGRPREVGAEFSYRF